MVEELKSIEETADKFIGEANDILDDSALLIDDIKYVAKESRTVFDHLRMLTWTLVKLAHVVMALILPLVAVLNFIK